MMVLPTLDIAKRISKKRLAKMISGTPVLADKVQAPRSRDAGNTLFMKEFPGGSIALVAANSPAGLRSDPVACLFMDEIDAYPADCGGEGDPVELATARTATFPNRKIFEVSTPTIAGLSRIEAAYDETDQRRFFVPCPDCGVYQILEWPRIKWEKNEAGQPLPDTAALECSGCGELIPEHKKTWMLARGEWRPTNPEAADPRRVGFHLSALYSPAGWRSWADIVRDFHKAKAHPARLKAWINIELGEVWREDGEAEDPEILMGRREIYPADPLPDGVVVLTAGVDVQDDRLEMEIIGWGRGGENWGIEHRVFRGDPAGAAVWASLDAAIQKRYDHPRIASQMPVAAVCVDSGGHYTTEVYSFCKARYGRRVFAIKGVGGAGRPLVSRPTKQRISNRPGYVRLFSVGVDSAKTAIYSNLKITQPGPNYSHFPARYEDEFFSQLCGEKRVIETNKKTGYPVHVWKKIHANEALDCRVYASAALELLSADLDHLADLMDRKADAAETGAPPPVDPTRPRQRPRKIFGKGGDQ